MTQVHWLTEDGGICMHSLDKLVVLWTSGDPITAEKMVFMYSLNAIKNAWWHELTLIIWGASAALASENEMIQDHLTALIEAGVDVVACKACADSLGATEKLESLGINVKYMGEPLTEYIKLDYKILSV